MMQRAFLALLVLSAGRAGCTIASPSAQPPPSLYDLFATQAKATLVQLGGALAYPTLGVAGKYGWLTSDANNWMSGYFPGTLLQLANKTGDAALLAAGRALTYGLASERFDTDSDNVGYIMYTSFGKLWRFHGDATAREYLFTAAASLSARFSTTVGCLRSWNSAAPTFEVIADEMMNLELLWWAAAETGNTTFAVIAHSHARRMMSDVFQPAHAGCAWHLVVYNESDGSLLSRSSTPQGLGLDTVWSRGQAWTVNGFVIAYRYTRDAAYLTQAQAAADCFIRLLTACCGNAVYNWAPLWDFNATAPQDRVDTSAMAIAAEGIAELSAYTRGARGAAYYAFAKQLLDAAQQYHLFNPTENDAVLRNGTTTFPVTGVSIVYGVSAAGDALNAARSHALTATRHLLSPRARITTFCRRR